MRGLCRKISAERGQIRAHRRSREKGKEEVGETHSYRCRGFDRPVACDRERQIERWRVAQTLDHGAKQPRLPTPDRQKRRQLAGGIDAQRRRSCRAAARQHPRSRLIQIRHETSEIRFLMSTGMFSEERPPVAHRRAPSPRSALFPGG